MSIIENYLNNPKLSLLSDVIHWVSSFEENLNVSNKQLKENSKIHFLRNITLENIIPFLKYHCYRWGIKVTVSFGGYDCIAQDILSSEFQSNKNDIVVMAILLDQLEPNYLLNHWSVGEVSDRIITLVDMLLSVTKSQIILNNFFLPCFSELGVTGAITKDSLLFKVSQLNKVLQDFVMNNPQLILIDFNQITSRIGYQNTFDQRFWYLSKSPFKPEFLRQYSEEITKVVTGIKGKAKKCLVLDCDNTLWGGIVGELGLKNIQLNPNEYPGAVYYDFQKTVIQLQRRGVLVLLNSKNNESDVWEVLNHHPYCLLKKEHIAAYRINWQDKVKNMDELAAELNLSLDSFVFVDDALVECDSVQRLRPEITVRQVPEKIYNYPNILLTESLFGRINESSEDSYRTQLYQINAQRKKDLERVGCQLDFEAYLTSLKLKVLIRQPEKHEIARVAQLTQKTNQFNLCTKRYTETDINHFLADHNVKIYILYVTDKFGDYGLTGVFIATRENYTFHVDTFLLSCRILGRRVEYAFASYCIQQLFREWCAESCSTEFIATPKNNQVEKFWESLGMQCLHVEVDRKDYQLQDTQQLEKVPGFIEIQII